MRRMKGAGGGVPGAAAEAIDARSPAIVSMMSPQRPRCIWGQYTSRMRESPGAAFVEILPRGPIDATLRPPSSKSLTLRAMAAAAMASGHSVIVNPLEAGDTHRMASALSALGISLAL